VTFEGGLKLGGDGGPPVLGVSGQVVKDGVSWLELQTIEEWRPLEGIIDGIVIPAFTGVFTLDGPILGIHIWTQPLPELSVLPSFLILYNSTFELKIDRLNTTKKLTLSECSDCFLSASFDAQIGGENVRRPACLFPNTAS
jgi:hypothetical protein